MSAPKNIKEQELKEKMLENPKLNKYLKNVQIKKVIFIQDKNYKLYREFPLNEIQF